MTKLLDDAMASYGAWTPRMPHPNRLQRPFVSLRSEKSVFSAPRCGVDGKAEDIVRRFYEASLGFSDATETVSQEPQSIAPKDCWEAVDVQHPLQLMSRKGALWYVVFTWAHQPVRNPLLPSYPWPAEPEVGPLATYEDSLACVRALQEMQNIGSLTSRTSCSGREQSNPICCMIELADSLRAVKRDETEDERSTDYWAIVRDDATDFELRCQSLQSLIAQEEPDVAEFIVEELNRADVPNVWRNYLVLCAENVQFIGEHLRTILRETLLALATKLRRSTEAGIHSVVFSSIRSYSSLIDQSEATSLMPFLEPPELVETRLVTLHCICHLFESFPPRELPVAPVLSNRVYELAEKFLDRDWLVAGEKAAIGESATHALATMGDERLGDCISKIKKLKLPWLTRQVLRKLGSTLQAWNSRVGHLSPANDFVQQQMNILAE